MEGGRLTTRDLSRKLIFEMFEQPVEIVAKGNNRRPFFINIGGVEVEGLKI